MDDVLRDPLRRFLGIPISKRMKVVEDNFDTILSDMRRDKRRSMESQRSLSVTHDPPGTKSWLAGR